MFTSQKNCHEFSSLFSPIHVLTSLIAFIIINAVFVDLQVSEQCTKGVIVFACVKHVQMTFKIRLEFTFMCSTLLGMLSIDKYGNICQYCVLLGSGDTKETPNWLGTNYKAKCNGNWIKYLYSFSRLGGRHRKKTHEDKQIKNAKLKENNNKAKKWKMWPLSEHSALVGSIHMDNTLEHLIVPICSQ